MAKEQEAPRLTGIHINLTEQLITLEAEDGRIARYSFAPKGTLYEAHPDSPEFPVQLEDRTTAPQEAPQAAASEAGAETEAKTTLLGRLNSKPKEGRADRSGKPTAWARFAGHVEGDDDWHPYLATFHRHTARVALGLPRDAHLTIEGYIHPRSSPTRMDTISVVNIAHYEGKPEKR